MFIVGGATYEEAKDIAVTFNNAETRVILGGTYIHNSKSFLTEITQIQYQKGFKQTAHFEIE